ncbi:hypothetical protein TeGR_g4948, partial [Tetraparma gracilis]
YLCKRIEELHKKKSSGSLLPLKIFIFSQFEPIRKTITDRLNRYFGVPSIAEFWGRDKDLELKRFAESDRCFILIANREATDGLDLSFVSHIFLMDEIYDASVKTQVVARAYRMGAKQSVEVETLIAKGSVEETRFEQEKATEEVMKKVAVLRREGKKIGKEENDAMKNATLHSLLSRLEFINPATYATPPVEAAGGGAGGGGLTGVKRSLQVVQEEDEEDDDEEEEGEGGEEGMMPVESKKVRMAADGNGMSIDVGRAPEGGGLL